MFPEPEDEPAADAEEESLPLEPAEAAEADEEEESPPLF